jgi:hypothetical protein
MPNKKISQLSTGSTLDGSELVPIVQGGITKKVTTQEIADLGGSSTTPTLQEVITESSEVTGTVYSSPDTNSNVFFQNEQHQVTVSNGVDQIVVEQTPTSFNKNGAEIATVNDIPSLSGLLLNTNNLSDVSNFLTARNNLGLNQLIITTGNQANSGTTNVNTDITGLSFTPAINKRYEIDGKIRFACSGNGGSKFQISLPTGATMDVILHGFAATGTAYTFAILTSSGTLSSSNFGNVTGGTLNGWVTFKGEVQMSSTAGDIVFGFASATNGQITTINQLGTIINITQLD